MYWRCKGGPEAVQIWVGRPSPSFLSAAGRESSSSSPFLSFSHRPFGIPIIWHQRFFIPCFCWKENSPVSLSTSLGAVTSSPATSDRGSLPGTSGSPIDGLRALRPSPVRIEREVPPFHLIDLHRISFRFVQSQLPPTHPENQLVSIAYCPRSFSA